MPMKRNIKINLIWWWFIISLFAEKIPEKKSGKENSLFKEKKMELG